MINSIKTSKGEFVFVEYAQKGSCAFKIIFGRLAYLHDTGYASILLPQSLTTIYTFLCTTDTITEDIAKGIVGDYDMPLVEFANLLDNTNLSPLKTYAICKKTD